MEHKSEEENSMNISIYSSDAICELLSSPYIKSPKTIDRYLKPELDLDVLTQFLQLIHKSPWNPVYLMQNNTPSYQHSRNEFDIISKLIEIILALSKKDEKHTIDSWMKLLSSFLATSGPLKQHYEKIYVLLNEIIFDCQNLEGISRHYSEITYIIKVLDKMVSIPQSSIKEPSSYFYFLPNSSSISTEVSPDTEWPFRDFFTIVMWVKCDEFSSISSLMRLRSSEKGFELYLINNMLNYRILEESYLPPSKFVIIYSIT